MISPAYEAISDEDLARATQRLARTGRTRVPFLTAKGAQSLYQAIINPNLPWVRAFDSPMNKDIDVAAFEASSAEDQQGFYAAAYDQARHQFQYIFDRLQLGRLRQEGVSLPAEIYAAMDLFNSPQFLDFARRLTGNDDIVFADGQVTRYLPGHFLTRHDDDNPDTRRLYAYVLNLTPEWRPEWGGLLQFFDAEGEITETFVPRLGTLNVFAVPQVHAVSSVAPFAADARYSLTGWWRARPLSSARVD